MNTTLSKDDYLNILRFYKIKANKNMSLKNIKNKAEKILVSKLCKCIKKVDKNINKSDDQRSIAICKKSIMTRKNLGFYKFKCKKTPKFLKRKKDKTKKKLYKLLK